MFQSGCIQRIVFERQQRFKQKNPPVLPITTDKGIDMRNIQENVDHDFQSQTDVMNLWIYHNVVAVVKMNNRQKN